MSMTLGEQMALAVLKGDRVAAYALADMLLEERQGESTKMAIVARAIRERSVPAAVDGWGVWRWPEFKAFCDRAGILWDLRTVSLKITIEEGAVLTVEQRYQGADNENQSIDTTSLHTGVIRPAMLYTNSAGESYDPQPDRGEDGPP